MIKEYYLAYGSNLNLRNMSFRCKNAKPIGSIVLNNYRLVYKGYSDDHSYLTIEKKDGYKIPLGLFEGYPELYSKHYIPIKFYDTDIKALIYIMNDGFEYHMPKQSYIDTCIEGYKDFGFDESILEDALKNTINNIENKIKKI